MDLKDIISISGKSGLFKVIGRRPTGLIVESMDAAKNRMPTTFTQKISVLDDIAMYTTSGEVRLIQVFANMQALGKTVDAKAENDVLINFFKEALPDYDSERVYASDIRKAISWFNILNGEMDFKALLAEAEKNEAEGKEEKADDKDLKKSEHPVAPKTVAPKNTAVKANSKSAGGAKTTYRPKSV